MAVTRRIFLPVVSLIIVGMLTASCSLTFSNSDAITVPDTGEASPYPSTIVVTNVDGTVTNIDVTLFEISSSAASDLDILLVGPTGASVVLMSDVGEVALDVTLTLDDDAETSLPDSATPLTSGTFKPTNASDAGPKCTETEDVFPDPAPAGPYSTMLAAFNGTDPNGTWSLYVIDDCAGDSSSIDGGWSLGIVAETTVDAEPPILTVPDNITVNATSPKGAVVTFAATATDDASTPTVECVPPSGSTFPVGTTTVSCTATDGVGNEDSGSFTVTVIGAGELLQTLRTLTIDLVANTSAERGLVATIDQAMRAEANGNPRTAYFLMLKFVVQLDGYERKGMLPSSVAHQLLAQVRLVYDAIY